MAKVRDNIDLKTLKERRRAIGLSGAQLANMVGVTKQTISNVECGRQYSLAVIKLMDYYINDYYEQHIDEFSDKFKTYYKWLSDLET